MALVKKYIEYKDVKISQIPDDLRAKIKEAHKLVSGAVENQVLKHKFDSDKEVMDSINEFQKQISSSEKVVRVYKVKEGKYKCMIQLMNHVKSDNSTEKGKKLSKVLKASFKQAKPLVEKKYKMELDNEGEDAEGFEGFDIYPSDSDSQAIWDAVSKVASSEAKEAKLDHRKEGKAIKESKEQNEYASMSIMKIIGSINQNIISSGKISDSDLNTISNEFTKKYVLPKTGKKITEFKLKLDNSKSESIFEIEAPSIEDSAVEGILTGKTDLYGILNSKKSISIKGTSEFFLGSKGSNDLYYFCENSVKYWMKSLKKLCNFIQNKFIHLDSKMKTLIKSTELKKIIAATVHQCLIFREAKITSHGIFSDQEKELKKLMVNWLFKKLNEYKDPEKDKEKIIKSFETLLKSYKESVFDSNLKNDSVRFFESMMQLYRGEFSKEIKEAEDNFINENTDYFPPKQYQTKILMETFGVKRLKKIPSDLLPYIRMQIDRITDENDKMMLASYTLSKIEIVEWYIELLTVGSNKYVVPHTLPQLQRILQELNFCYKKIVSTRISGASGSVQTTYGRLPGGYEY